MWPTECYSYNPDYPTWKKYMFFSYQHQNHNNFSELHILLKALLQVCMEIIAWGDVSRDKYITRWRRMLYLSQDTSLCAIFVHMSVGSVLSGILYFELLLSQQHSLVHLECQGHAWICVSWHNIKWRRAIYSSKA